jgi:hypothetical protein
MDNCRLEKMNKLGEIGKIGYGTFGKMIGMPNQKPIGGKITVISVGVSGKKTKRICRPLKMQ